ncbi:MAG TPA: hypothetical protein ENN19_04980 [Chloroflexi bacterium]|nr:hypothetical protein [Chloroflexota bacterium]
MTEEWVVVIDHETADNKHPCGEPFDECWENGTLLIRSQRPKLGSGCLPFFVEMCAILPALIVFALGLIAVFF